MRGPGGPAGLQNRFATVIRPWRFDSPAFRDVELVSTLRPPLVSQSGLLQAKAEMLTSRRRRRVETLRRPKGGE